MKKQTEIAGNITMLVREADVPFAAKIFRALDPDTGGAESFGPPNVDGLCLASMPASAETIELFNSFETETERMQKFIEEDYEKRWKQSEEEKASIKDATAIAKAEPIKAADIARLKEEAITLVGSVEDAVKLGYRKEPKVLVVADEELVKGGK